MTNKPHFDGSDYIAKFDHARLTGQLKDLYNLMKDGKWRTVETICADLSLQFGKYYPQPSISANLRNFRKERFGLHTVEKRFIGDRIHGIFEYRLIVKS